jgi:hypothetical protein
MAKKKDTTTDETTEPKADAKPVTGQEAEELGFVGVKVDPKPNSEYTAPGSSS